MWELDKLYHQHDEATMKYFSQWIKTLRFLQLFYLEWSFFTDWVSSWNRYEIEKEAKLIRDNAPKIN